MAAVVAAVALAGCGGGASTAGPAASAATSTAVEVPASASAAPATTSATATPTQAATEASSGAADPRLIGVWQRRNSCTAYVTALKDAALWDRVPDWLLGAYWPSRDAIPAGDPCAGITDVDHSHFFTAAGAFGSYDEHGAQVDDGDYEVVDSGVLAFPSHEREFGSGPIRVGYDIGDDGLEFDVVVPDPCDDACAIGYGWAIAAFYPGAFAREP